jgi:hypothetical protein
MRKRTLHTSINLLIEPATYQRLRVAARERKTSMAEIIREGINLRLDQIDKVNAADVKQEKQKHNSKELEIELIL